MHGLVIIASILAVAPVDSSAVAADHSPRATLIIVNGARASAMDWEIPSSVQRREIVREEDGQAVRLLLTEFE